MDIASVINDRILSSGISRAELAKHIDTTPSQLGLFLKGEASLTIKSLNKCFDLLNVDVMMYKNRNDLAKKVAKTLKIKGVKDITHWSKNDIIALTGVEELKLFREEKKEELKQIAESGYIDPESTFNYIKDLIGYYLMAPDIDKITKKQAENTKQKLMKVYNGSGHEVYIYNANKKEHEKCDGYEEDDEKPDLIEGIGKWLVSAVGIAGAAIGVFGLIDIFRKD